MPSARGIRFAMQLTHAASGAEWVELVRRTEDEGYATISLPDHLGPQFAPIPALAAAAAVTSRVHLSMFVLANDWRNPAMLAKEVATIERLSDGRMELGIGAGWDANEYRGMGVPFDRPSVRIERLAEAVTILRGLLAGETVTFEGAHYQVHDLAVLPAPVRPGGVPITLGGGGRKMLSLAARVGDVVSIATNNSARTVNHGVQGQPVRWTDVREQVSWVRQSAGARYPDLELNIRVLGVASGPDRPTAAATLSQVANADADEILDSPFMLVGTVDEMCEHIERVRAELDVSYFTVSQRHAEMLAPVVAAMSRR